MPLSFKVGVSRRGKISTGGTLWEWVQEAVNAICNSIFAFKNHSDVACGPFLHRRMFSSYFLSWLALICFQSPPIPFFFNLEKKKLQQTLKPSIPVFAKSCVT